MTEQHDGRPANGDTSLPAMTRLFRETTAWFSARNSYSPADSFAEALSDVVMGPLSQPDLIQKVQSLGSFIAPGAATELRGRVLDALTEDARTLSECRFAEGRAASLWGVTPIINLRTSVLADRALGNVAHSIVYTTYRVTHDFDICLSQRMEWCWENGPETGTAFTWCVLAWALLHYDSFHFFNDRGLLHPAGDYGRPWMGIDREELRLIRAAGKRLFTYTYGADHRTREATQKIGPYNFW